MSYLCLGATAVLLLMIAGCVEGNDGLNMGADGPDIELSVRALDFGIHPLQRPEQRAIDIANVGDRDLKIESVRIESALAFATVNNLDGKLIAPGESVSVEVEFLATNLGAASDTLVITSNDVDEPQARVELLGFVSDPGASLDVSPVSLNFGVSSVGCAQPEQTVSVSNPNAQPAQLTAISVAPGATPGFVVSDLPVLPQWLPPGDTVQFSLGFTPSLEGEHMASVVVDGNVASTAVQARVSVLGSGDLSRQVVDRFEQLALPQTDILFVIDDSSSMVEEQANIEFNLRRMIEFTAALNNDFHIAVTTSSVLGAGAPAGRLLPLGTAGERVITPMTPNPVDALLQNGLVGADPGRAESHTLEAALRALTPPLSEGHNDGFQRPDASLVVVLVSDGADTSPQSVPAYVDGLRALKDPVLSLAIIGGPRQPRSGCEGPGGLASSTPRLYAVGDQIGGLQESICGGGDWGLERLFPVSFGFKRRFRLSEIPAAPVLSVEVNGVDIPAAGNWFYERDDNDLVFELEAVPPPSAEIVVRYIGSCS